MDGTDRQGSKQYRTYGKRVRIWGLDVEAIANDHLWTLYRRVENQEISTEIVYEAVPLEKNIQEKFDAEVRAG